MTDRPDCNRCSHLSHTDWCDETVMTGSSTQEMCGCSPQADRPDSVREHHRYRTICQDCGAGIDFDDRITAAQPAAALDVLRELADAAEGVTQYVRVGDGPLGVDPAAIAMRRLFDALGTVKPFRPPHRRSQP
jgi:hypothetical protein